MWNKAFLHGIQNAPFEETVLKKTELYGPTEERDMGLHKKKKRLIIKLGLFLKPHRHILRTTRKYLNAQLSPLLMKHLVTSEHSKLCSYSDDLSKSSGSHTRKHFLY